ncbi:conserved protein, unknown function [Hepatocystis sp. ex Piliocolobus tephrosceles]|nr:conserved protein, unknown function [Hepatocystis sp. ex Piliocolobus tephrosceles]
MTTIKNANYEKIITPIIRNEYPKSIKIKSLQELQQDQSHKIYTNIYSYNTLYNGIFISKGINGVTGGKGSGKSSMCKHICVNLFFNNLLHFFHLFYSAYDDFELFLQKKNIKNEFCYETSIKLNTISKQFNECKKKKNIQALNELITYFTDLFIELYDKKQYIYTYISHFLNPSQVLYNKNKFSKKRIIYLDLDNSFYIDKYKNMIYSSIENIKKLLKTYMNFINEKKCILFLLVIEKNHLQKKKQLFHIYKNYSKEGNFFIYLFNHYLEKYIYDIKFSDVFLNLQILKIFHFNELVNIVNFIHDQVNKYANEDLLYFNNYIPRDLGLIVVDNINYINKCNTIINIPSNTNDDVNNNATISTNFNIKQFTKNVNQMLKELSNLSIEHNICVLITNNDNKYFKKSDIYFNKLYTKYLYRNIVLKYINQKIYLDYICPNEIKKEDNRSDTTYSEDSLYDHTEDNDKKFYEKRYNQRYIKMKKKKKKGIACFFEITKFGIKTL